MSLPDELKRLYREGGGWREFFDALSVYQKPTQSLSVERASEISGLAHETILAGMRQLAELKIGNFKFGRRGGKTRLEWRYSPGSVGRVAQGKQDELEAYADEGEDEALQEATDLPPPAAGAPLSTIALIAEAKRALAVQLGIAPERIDIVIRY